MTNRIDVSKFTIASKDVNKFKNRLVNVLPCKHRLVSIINCDIIQLDDHCRVTLEGKPGDEGSDYINASFIDVSCDIVNKHCCIIVLLHMPFRATIKKQPTLLPRAHYRTLVVISGE